MPSTGEGGRSSPALLRRRLAGELRRLRKVAGLTTERVADHLYCSVSKLSRVETGRVAVTLSDLRDMLSLYEVNSRQREELEQLARQALQKEEWWQAYGDIRDVTGYISLEESADHVRTYQSLIIPGLLQTESYARSITATIFGSLAHQEIERRVELRMTRQSLLTRHDSPKLEVVLDEAALHRVLGTSQLVAEQFHRLIEVAGMPNVTFQFIPFGAGLHGGMTGAFTILSFPDPLDPDVVYIEHPSGDLYLDGAERTHRYGMLFQALQAVAATPRESIVVLVELAKPVLGEVEFSVTHTIEERAPLRNAEGEDRPRLLF